MFNLIKDAISYSYTNNIILLIRNKRSWKAVIGEMYTKGLLRFIFFIKEGYKYLFLLSP